MANNGVKMSDFTQLSQVANGDKIIMLHNGNAQADYSVVANTIIDKMKRENVVTTQTNNNNKIPSAGLIYGMNETIEDLQESTSTEQEEKSVTAKIVTVDDADGGEAGLTLNLEPTQSGSGDPSPDNVRPITGWTGAKVTRTGKNLLTESNYRVQSAYNMTASKIESGVKFVGTPTWGSGSGIPFRIGWVNDIFSKFGASPKVLVKSDNSLCVVERATIQNDGSISVWCTTTATSSSITINFSVMVYFGNAETEVAPIQGETYDITFPSEAGTVYGGMLTINPDRTGTLVVKDAAVDMGDLTWTYNLSSGHERLISNAISPSAKSASGSTLANAICSMYKTATSNQVYAHSADCIFCVDGDGRIQVYDSGYTDATAFKTAVTGQKIVYELATPITYQLTPIEVTTLIGYNTIWMDADGTIKLDYKTNAVATKGDVNDALARIKALAKITEAIAPVESSYTATQNYAIGDYLIVDYKLYKVTAAITSGATITEGTNVTATTIMAEIQALA